MNGKNNIIQGFIHAVLLMAFAGIVLGVDIITKGLFSGNLGIDPRELRGLDGIIFAPILHGDFNHFISNFIPMVVLLGLLFANNNYKPWRSLILIWIIGGFGTWLIGRPPTHIGASIIIFGLIAFLIIAAIRLRSWRSVTISSIVFFMYGGAISGIFPPLLNSNMSAKISWEGHLSGAIGGIVAAWVIRKR